ncbi:GCN5-related N-acetyltransferase [Candidatus Paraburkholderia kirkii]|nr:GCN5-related N-acetyltransferase [Candidatus Paraburkholderia kirkii]
MNHNITVRRLGANEASGYIEALVDVLIGCVEGGASVSFMLPISRTTAVEFWTRIAHGVARDERILLVAEDAQETIVGTVQIVVDQPHRADVAKMLVVRRARRQGIARRLMAAADDAARAAGKSVLVLDTVTGGNAEHLYERAGWQRVGVVPNYALMPDSTSCATTFFHKQLA